MGSNLTSPFGPLHMSWPQFVSSSASLTSILPCSKGKHPRSTSKITTQTRPLRKVSSHFVHLEEHWLPQLLSRRVSAKRRLDDRLVVSVCMCVRVRVHKAFLRITSSSRKASRPSRYHCLASLVTVPATTRSFTMPSTSNTKCKWQK